MKSKTFIGRVYAMDESGDSGLRVFAWPDWLAGFISKCLHIIVAVSLTYVALKCVDVLTGYWKQRRWWCWSWPPLEEAQTELR